MRVVSFNNSVVSWCITCYTQRWVFRIYTLRRTFSAMITVVAIKTEGNIGLLCVSLPHSLRISFSLFLFFPDPPPTPLFSPLLFSFYFLSNSFELILLDPSSSSSSRSLARSSTKLRGRRNFLASRLLAILAFVERVEKNVFV